ncbi:MAG TPA: 50S ribosomal protein L9 [Gemmata sp.]|jgi:large subunit ribosomal protein L9|nr:50S ribosomal protein L9 [Gemmata sp.]
MAKTAKKPETKSEKPTGKKLPTKKVKQRRQVKKGPHGGTMVVLVNDLVHVGKQGDLVEVKPGYARNYLLPYGQAVIPTIENLRTLEQYKIKVQKAREAKVADLKVLAEQLSRLPAVTIEANATEEGHLYGSIGPTEISKTLKGKNLLVEIDMVKLENHIKEANTLTEVPLSLGYGIEAKIQVLVVALQSGAKK